jgi:hypothetical protein
MAQPIGQFGLQAAKHYQQVAPAKRHATEVRYTPDFNQSEASADLFQYARHFAQNPDAFTPAEIEAASGLNLSELPKRETLTRLWDTDGNGSVDLKEAFVGLAHLDFADGAADGRITNAGRTAVEDFYLGYRAVRQLKASPLFKQQSRFIEQVAAGKVFNGPQAGTTYPGALPPNTSVNALGAIEQQLTEAGQLDGNGLAETFRQQQAQLLEETAATFHQIYQGELRQVASAVAVTRRHQSFMQNFSQ